MNSTTQPNKKKLLNQGNYQSKKNLTTKKKALFFQKKNILKKNSKKKFIVKFKIPIIYIILTIFSTFATMHTTSFKDFLMRDELKNRISSFGFEHPSEVQQQCLPNSLLGFDILCQAKAGMGKTAVFILTILNRFLEGNIKGEGAVLVLTHTRELAFQISKEFVNFSQGLDIKTLLIIGGENTQEQINKIKNDKPNIIIGTPGRILALIKKKDLNCDHVQAFVIDECDKMLSALGKIFILKKIFYFLIIKI